jgi:hypothetical protein
MSGKEYGQSVRRKKPTVASSMTATSISPPSVVSNRTQNMSNSAPSLASTNNNYYQQQQPQQPQQPRNVSMPPVVQSSRASANAPTSASTSVNKSSAYNSNTSSSGTSGGALSAPSVPQEGLREIVKRRLFEDIFKDCMGMF